MKRKLAIFLGGVLATVIMVCILIVWSVNSYHTRLMKTHVAQLDTLLTSKPSIADIRAQYGDPYQDLTPSEATSNVWTKLADYSTPPGSKATRVLLYMHGMMVYVIFLGADDHMIGFKCFEN